MVDILTSNVDGLAIEANDQSVHSGWSKFPQCQWLVKVSGVTAIATDCLVNTGGS